jgi:hypothetical protein
MQAAIQKIDKLRNFKIFQEDISKPVPKGEKSECYNSIEKMILLIKFKEEVLEKNYSLNMVRELMSLYQKV